MDISSMGMGQAINSGLDAISTRTGEIQTQMKAISQMDAQDQNVAMMEMQFVVGQYNAMIESTSNMIKTLSDALKSIAQKI